MQEWIEHLPKAELHLHIEGTLEPEMLFALAKRNKVALRYKSVEEVRAKYVFNDLQSFLDIYYQGMQVLVTEEDFYDLAMAYFRRIVRQGVEVAEIFFDPQAHMHRGVPFKTVISGIYKAIAEASQELKLRVGLIMCFLRDLPEEDALETLDQALNYREWLLGVGLDSAEKNNPPGKFRRVYDIARSHGLKLVAHAGEEGPPEYIWEALEILQVARIDHGIRCMEDPKLVAKLRDEQIPLTVCPLSNVKLKAIQSLEEHPIRRMLEAGLCVTINSDDPAYFGGYINTNYVQTQAALDFSKEQIALIAENSLRSAFV